MKKYIPAQPATQSEYEYRAAARLAKMAEDARRDALVDIVELEAKMAKDALRDAPFGKRVARDE